MLPGLTSMKYRRGTDLCRGAERGSVSVTPCSASKPHLPAVFFSVTGHSVWLGPEPRQGGGHSSWCFAQGTMPIAPANHALQVTADSAALATPEVDSGHVLCQMDAATLLFHLKLLESPQGLLFLGEAELLAATGDHSALCLG